MAVSICSNSSRHFYSEVLQLVVDDGLKIRNVNIGNPTEALTVIMDVLSEIVTPLKKKDGPNTDSLEPRYIEISSCRNPKIGWIYDKYKGTIDSFDKSTRLEGLVFENPLNYKNLDYTRVTAFFGQGSSLMIGQGFLDFNQIFHTWNSVFQDRDLDELNQISKHLESGRQIKHKEHERQFRESSSKVQNISEELPGKKLKVFDKYFKCPCDSCGYRMGMKFSPPVASCNLPKQNFCCSSFNFNIEFRNRYRKENKYDSLFFGI